MIYTNLEEANDEIVRLNAELLKTSGTREIVTNYIECSVDLLDKPVPFPDFVKEDGSYHSILSYCEVTGRAVEYNHDKSRFMFGYELSDLYNIYSGLKDLLTNMYGKALGGADFTAVGDAKIWILTYTEKKEYKLLNPNWNSVNENI